MKKIITGIFLFVNFFVFAQDSLLEEPVKKEINYNEEDYFGFTLKVLPNNPSLAIASATKYTEKHTDDFRCDLILLLIDTQTQKIIDRYTEKNKFQSDAYYLYEVALDMANYKVSDTDRAFGVRSTYSGSSRVNPFGQTDIALFIIKNNKILRLMDFYKLDDHSGEWDGECTYDGEETNSVLIMEKEKTNGFYNIQIKSSKTIRKSETPKTPDDDCIEMDKKLRPTYKTLRFVKGKYQPKK